MNDLKFAFRQSLKHKGSSLLAMLILALGIGGTTAVFSVADKVLLNPIPGRNGDRLFTLREIDVMHDSHWNASPPLIQELASCSNLIESLTYCFQGPAEKKFRVGEKVVKLQGATVAPNFFDLFELRPLAGRTFLAGEGRDGTAPTIVVSEGFWRQYFGADPRLIGRSIGLDETAYLVIGIMPSNVQFPFGTGYSQFWVPHVFTGEEINSEWAAKNRVWQAIARLHDVVNLPSLQSTLDAVA